MSAITSGNNERNNQSMYYICETDRGERRDGFSHNDVNAVSVAQGKMKLEYYLDNIENIKQIL